MALPCENSPSGLTDPRIASLFGAGLADVGRLPCCESGLCPVQNFIVYSAAFTNYARTSDGRMWLTRRVEHVHDTDPLLNRTEHYDSDIRGRSVTSYNAAAWEVAAGTKPAPPAFTAEAGPETYRRRPFTISTYWASQVTVPQVEAVIYEDYLAYTWEHITEATTPDGSGSWAGLHWPGDTVQHWAGPLPWPVSVYYHDILNPGTFRLSAPLGASELVPGRYQYQVGSADDSWGYRDVYCNSAGHIRFAEGVAIARARIRGNGIVCEVTRTPTDAGNAALGHTEWPVTCLEHAAPQDGSPNIVYAEPTLLPFAAATPSPTQGSFTGLFDFPVRYFPYNPHEWVIAQPRCATRQGAVAGTGWEWNPAYL